VRNLPPPAHFPHSSYTPDTPHTASDYPRPPPPLTHAHHLRPITVNRQSGHEAGRLFSVCSAVLLHTFSSALNPGYRYPTLTPKLNASCFPTCVSSS
jgi:hypothetical protein